MTNNTGSVLYTGVTNDIEFRVKQHKTGYNPNSFTSRYKLTRLVYCERAGNDVRAAIEREKQIKGSLRARKIALIRAQNPFWKDLSIYPQVGSDRPDPPTSG